MQVIIYSTTSCPYCKMLKGYLKEKGVAFSEKIVDQDLKSQKEMVALSQGAMAVPFTVVTKEDGLQVKITGFDKKKIDETLGIIGIN